MKPGDILLVSLSCLQITLKQTFETTAYYMRHQVAEIAYVYSCCLSLNISPDSVSFDYFQLNFSSHHVSKFYSEVGSFTCCKQLLRFWLLHTFHLILAKSPRSDMLHTFQKKCYFVYNDEYSFKCLDSKDTFMGLFWFFF